ncbi:hypothetical protein P3T76_007117 [Phytophthora citrophthora]|uniref:Uncharacterized protein n=1 Tax=Phytophthora citrophthora TaxID=4793 RepID=A0AAD9GNR1_9STRA|nr:hypothetical protein P3T76_007117 [Phytophthora citrophthora]
MELTFDPSEDNLAFSAEYYQNLDEVDPSFQTAIAREERRCRYPSKRCEFPRAIKRNGEMHRFCDIHRDKANLNQRRLEARRKREMEDTETPQRKRRSTSTDSENSSGVGNQVPWLKPCESSSPPLHSVLAQDELNFLSDLLSQNSLEDLHVQSTTGEQGTSSFAC